MSTTIFLSLSRSGWISALVAVAIYFSQKNWIDALKAHRNKAIAVLGLVLVIFVFIPGTRNTLVNRTINLAGLKADYSYSHRIASYRTTLNILKHYPLFGVGLGNYPAVHETYYAKGAHIQIKTPDNIYLRFLCETGIIGTVLFFTILMYWLYVLFVNRRDSFVAAIFAGLAGFMINQAVADLFFWTVTQFTFWLLLGIAVSRVYSNEQKISI
jgi:O-antigen ligase